VYRIGVLSLSLSHEAALIFCRFSGGAFSSTCLEPSPGFVGTVSDYLVSNKLRSNSAIALHNLVT
jgi:hypothetical protein